MPIFIACLFCDSVGAYYPDFTVCYSFPQLMQQVIRPHVRQMFVATQLVIFCDAYFKCGKDGLQRSIKHPTFKRQVYSGLFTLKEPASFIFRH